MILTGAAIRDAVRIGDIVIRPFRDDRIGPNSYDFQLGDRCKVYRDEELDSSRENPTVDVPFREDGLLLDPRRLYLFNTVETMGSTRYVPIIRGRSSVGRLGVFIDITSDLIDLGSINQWTLQVHAVTPVRVFPRMLIGQVTFWVPTGEITLYAGKYSALASPVPSLSFRDRKGTDGDS